MGRLIGEFFAGVISLFAIAPTIALDLRYFEPVPIESARASVFWADV